jgi:hypothetical protein
MDTQDNRLDDFDLNEWGNTTDDILDSKWNRKRNKQEREKSKINSREHYNLGHYVLRSPGNDLLDFYDSMMLRLDKTSKAWSYIPPSVVHYFRHKHEYPKYVFDKSKNFGVYRYLRETLKNYYDTDDHTYWAQIHKLRYNWITDNPHTEYVFENAIDLDNYLKTTFGQKGVLKTINVKTLITNANTTNLVFEGMWWRGNLAGWSVVFIPNERCNQLIDQSSVSITSIETYNHKEIIDLNDKVYRLHQEKIVQTTNEIMFMSDVSKLYNVSFYVIRNNIKKNLWKEMTLELYYDYCKKNKKDVNGILDNK